MHLIFGGAFQGKLEYAKKLSGAKDDEIFNCKELVYEEIVEELFKKDEINFKIIYGLEHFSLLCAEKGMEARDFFEKNIFKFKGKYLVADDVSAGVVPISKEMRQYREMNGRLLIYLSSSAIKVSRIFCGLAQNLKEGENSKIYLLRHGKTEGNEKKWYYGSTDLPLLEEGIKELEEMLKEGVYKDIVCNHYYTSGMLRANQTMNVLFGKVRREVIKDLSERYFGSFEKHSHEELLENPEYIRWISESTETENPGGVESMTEFRSRIRRGFNELLDMHLKRRLAEDERDRNSVCICHAGTISAIIMYLFEPLAPNFYAYTPNTGRGYVIEIENGKPVSYSKI